MPPALPTVAGAEPKMTLLVVPRAAPTKAAVAPGHRARDEATSRVVKLPPALGWMGECPAGGGTAPAGSAGLAAGCGRPAVLRGPAGGGGVGGPGAGGGGGGGGGGAGGARAGGAGGGGGRVPAAVGAVEGERLGGGDAVGQQGAAAVDDGAGGGGA